MVQISASRTRPQAQGRREARRAEILRRAADAFREKGFHGAAMRDIAATLGMTPGNLYYYFKSKDDLLYFCQRQALTRLLAGARKILADDLPPQIRLRELVQAHVLCLLEETGGSAAFLPHKTLLEVLREDMGLTGTKHGCELGECGTCTVIVDGEAVLSCLLLGLECDGREITTVEGLALSSGPHPLQAAFADLNAA